MAKRPPSMFDVAQASGVSHQTVSRVLNNHESVSEKTRAKVLASMEKLGYRPNLAARPTRIQLKLDHEFSSKNCVKP